MKIGAFSIPEITLGKHNLKDSRLDQIYKITNLKKETYVQLELVNENACLDLDAIVVLEDFRADLILKDLEFIETRLARSQEEQEKSLLNKLKGTLEKEEFIFNAQLTREEKQEILSYGLLTNKPIIVAKREDLEDLDNLLFKCIGEGGFISFFTIAGGQEARAWLIKKGITAWEAAGSVHSDIQRGFIRAEIISFSDFVQAGGETQAKQAGKLHLEQKNYVLQDGDIVNFRFNK